jgi:hypothetical protein
MTERQRIAGLAEQIELARNYKEQWPDWLRSTAHFSGSNHAGDMTPYTDEDDRPKAADQGAAAA